MARPPSNKTTVLEENCLFLKQAPNGIYYYHLSLNKTRPQRKSTGSRSKSNASLIALAALEAAKAKLKNGLDPTIWSFEQLIEEYLLSIQGQGKFKYHSETIARHFVPYFKKFTDISDIKKIHLDEYTAFRRNKNEEVLPQTLNRENGVLNKVFVFASDRERIKPGLKIKFLSEHQTRKRRTHFNKAEFKLLIETSKKRIEELEKLTGKPKGLAARKLNQRRLIHDIIVIIFNTGIRVDEIKHIKWRDIDFDKHEIQLSGVGKTKSQRRLIVRNPGIIALKRLRKRRTDYLRDNDLPTLDENEYIQSMPDGRHVASMKKGLNSILEAAGFLYSNGTSKHCMTSLRHSYATYQLSGKQKRASTQAVAKQMGTSIKMIEKHYGHGEISDYRDELLGE